jgi:hypothetical protein
MNIQVTPHTIAITINNNINAGEYNITPCEFTFTEEYENLTKEAIFSSCDGSVIKTSILSNQCTIPFEVLQQEGNVLLGVYAYETDDDELVLRYSPTPQYFNVKKGSFQVGNDPDLPSPTEWERVLEQINQAIEETNNLNITANKEGKVTTITITKKDGTTQTIEIEDGKSLEFKWEGTSLGIKQEGQSQYQYTNLQGPKGDAGAIHMIIVQTLPTEDIDESAIYLVPLENPTEEGNNYAEYVYINNQWELLGKIGVQVDLTDYVKNTDYATGSVGGVIKSGNGFTVSSNGYLTATTYSYADYGTKANTIFIGKGTLENVITGKGLVSNTDYATSSVGGVVKGSNNWAFATSNEGFAYSLTKTYAEYQTATGGMFIGKATLENVLTARIGDIQTLLDNLDVGNGV